MAAGLAAGLSALRELPMLLGCHSDVPTQEEGWVSVNAHFETPHIAGCQLVIREGQDCLSSALKWTWVHFILLQIAFLRCISTTCYSEVGLEGKLPFPLNSFYRNVGIIILIWLMAHSSDFSQGARVPKASEKETKSGNKYLYKMLFRQNSS